MARGVNAVFEQDFLFFVFYLFELYACKPNCKFFMINVKHKSHNGRAKSRDSIGKNHFGSQVRTDGKFFKL